MMMGIIVLYALNVVLASYIACAVCAVCIRLLIRFVCKKHDVIDYQLRRSNGTVYTGWFRNGLVLYGLLDTAFIFLTAANSTEHNFGWRRYNDTYFTLVMQFRLRLPNMREIVINEAHGEAQRISEQDGINIASISSRIDLVNQDDTLSDIGRRNAIEQIYHGLNYPTPREAGLSALSDMNSAGRRSGATRSGGIDPRVRSDINRWGDHVSHNGALTTFEIGQGCETATRTHHRRMVGSGVTPVDLAIFCWYFVNKPEG